MYDTVALLKETNAGCKSATNAIERILPYIKSRDLKDMVEEYNTRHAKIGATCTERLHGMGESEKDPHPVSGALSQMGIVMSASFRPKETHLADLLAEGCSMGMRSISRYLNQYPGADPTVRDLAGELIGLEDDFMHDLLPYL